MTRKEESHQLIANLIVCKMAALKRHLEWYSYSGITKSSTGFISRILQHILENLATIRIGHTIRLCIIDRALDNVIDGCSLLTYTPEKIDF